MQIIATKVLVKELKPGDLFSTASQDYFDTINADPYGSIGEKVYIRTNYKTPENEMNASIFKVTIIK